MNRTVIAAIGILLVVGGVLTLVTTTVMKNRVSKGSISQLDESWKNISILEDYRLVDQTGKVFDSRSLAGDVHVVSFFFALCPGPCFLQNKAVQSLQETYGSQGVKFVSITCNPEQDTPEVLREYSRKFDARPEQWRFLTGDLLHIRRIGAEIYRVPVDKGTHTEVLIAIDRAGKLRGTYDWKNKEKIAELRTELDRMLAEKPALTTEVEPTGS